MLSHRAFHELRPQTTAHLAQTMTFLHMSTTELEAALRNELNKNPALELVEELRCPQCNKRLTRLPCPTCAAPREDDLPVVFLSPRQPSGGRNASDGEERDTDLEARQQERLEEHLLRQIAPMLEPHERPIAAYLLARLDEDGFFDEPLAEAAAYLRVPPSAVERVLGLIQRADPPGVGARTRQESLLIQLDSLVEAGACPAALATPARHIIEHHLDALARQDYARLARALRIPPALATQAAQFIQRNLTPYPARAFWGEGKLPHEDVVGYREPDITISQMRHSKALMVEISTPLSGWLRVNPQFKAALQENTAFAGDEEREKWAQAVERAALITKCLQQRNHTLRRLMEVIATEQRDFILGGDGDLRPLTRSRVARALGVHESTISRAVAGKSIALPSGRIVPLAKFFDRSLSVRDQVRRIIEAETHPLTDDEIAARLAEEGVHVARRTVAKYRNMLGILPAHLRGLARARAAALAPMTAYAE
ncbi:MAG: RNA polymerase factor sigma-54 [Anaerolineales bacterium]|nr:RNA polymerase factor sigma-54 [Anaerolineales bacterium]